MSWEEVLGFEQRWKKGEGCLKRGKMEILCTIACMSILCDTLFMLALCI